MRVFKSGGCFKNDFENIIQKYNFDKINARSVRFGESESDLISGLRVCHFASRTHNHWSESLIF